MGRPPEVVATAKSARPRSLSRDVPALTHEVPDSRSSRTGRPWATGVTFTATAVLAPVDAATPLPGWAIGGSTVIETFWPAAFVAGAVPPAEEAAKPGSSWAGTPAVAPTPVRTRAA